MKITSVAATATALTAAFVLTACSDETASGNAPNSTPAVSSPSDPTAQASAEHNDADIAFARGMIPHHQQAVEMSKLAATRAGGDVRRLATTIEQAQSPEIAKMRGFLASWNASESGMDHEAEDHESGDHGGDSGMMSDGQMRRLEQADGAAFDRMFLEMMIAHHEGAVRMAGAQLTDGINPEATTLAREIIAAQRAEITEMRDLLG